MATAAMYLDDDDDIVLDPAERDMQDAEELAEEVAEEEGQRAPAHKDAKTDGAQQTRKRAVRAPKPKLTVEMLEETKALNQVFETFPDAFRSRFKGKGHEVSDLQRLLELYLRWQRRIFAHCSYDEFINKIEKLSSKRDVKDKLAQLRQQLILLLDPEEPQQEEVEEPAPQPGPAQGPQQRGAAPPPGPAAATLAGRPATQQQVAPPRPFPGAGGGAAAATAAANGGAARGAAGGRAAPPAPGGGAGGGGGGDVELDDFDEELLAMQADTGWEAAMDVLDELDQDQGQARDQVPRGGKEGAAVAASGGRGGAGAQQQPAGPGGDGGGGRAGAGGEEEDAWRELEDDVMLLGGEATGGGVGAGAGGEGDEVEDEDLRLLEDFEGQRGASQAAVGAGGEAELGDAPADAGGAELDVALTLGETQDGGTQALMDEGDGATQH